MSEYLIVAEVDKIQSFIFRSSRLREIAGGSHLLTAFGDTIKAKYSEWLGERNVLSTGGGNFRLVVNDQMREAVIRDLRQRFEREIGGSMTITWIPYESETTVIQQGNRALRQAKLIGDVPEPLWHSPYHAICASSGEELAVAFRKPIDMPGERERYMGKITLRKGEIDAKVAISRKLRDKLAKLTELKAIQVHEKATEAETYAWDARQYVAYLVADGNSMGKNFNNCTPEMLKQLSPQIGDTTLNALANAIMHLIHRGAELLPARGFERDTLPVLPLISGGDDLFVLMPAPWSIHVASQFCEAYQKGMGDKLRDMKLIGENENATTGAAVVICKASYPYRTAYQYAHELLGKAKRRAKELNQSCLIVDFVVGSDTVAESNRIQPESHTFEEAGFFVDQRFALRGLPSRFCIRLRKHSSISEIRNLLSSVSDSFIHISNTLMLCKRHFPTRLVCVNCSNYGISAMTWTDSGMNT